MLELTKSAPVVPQVSLELQLRGNPPALDTIKFSDSATCSDTATGLQKRSLSKAVATTLALFRAYEGLTLFRIRCRKPKGSLVHIILNAKEEPYCKSQIRGLARGLFMQLFLRPKGGEDDYFDIDLARLQPGSVKIILDGRLVDGEIALRNLAEKIAATGSWEFADYQLEVNFTDGAKGVNCDGRASNRERIEPQTGNAVLKTLVPEQRALSDEDRKTSREGFSTEVQTLEVLQDMCGVNSIPVDHVEAPIGGVLDNPALAAIREAIRHFCPNHGDQRLRVGAIRSPAELEDLWAIDRAAYGEAFISYERFKDWWSSFPLGLRALFFQSRVMGAVGIWPLSVRCAGLLKSARLKESELTGRMMRSFLHSPARYWYVSGILLRPELVGSRAIKILLSQGIGSLLKCAKIEFPCELLALAYSAQGQALLEGFNFYRVQNATAMPDHVHLFGLELGTRERLVSLLRDRGLDVDSTYAP